MSPTASPSKHRALGLTDHEYELIVERLDREPSTAEPTEAWLDEALAELPDDQQHAVALAGEQHGGRRARAAGPDHDGVVHGPPSSSEAGAPRRRSAGKLA